MTDAIRDNNHVPIALGVSSTDATVTLPFKIDSATGRLLTNSASGSGDVVGPASATDNAIARFNTTTGKLIQDSSVLIDDSDNVTGIGNITGVAGGITLSTATNGNITIDPGGSGTTTLNAGSGGVVISTDAGNANVNITPHGTGEAQVGGDKIVTEDATQTLTNKTIDSGSNTITLARIAGSTYSTLQEMNDTFHSAGTISGGTINDAGGGNITVDAGTGYIRATDSQVAELVFNDWGALGSTAIPSDTIRYVGVEYNAGAPQVVVRTTYSWNFNTDYPLGNVVNEGGVLHIESAPHEVGDHANFMIQRTYQTMGIKRDNVAGGIALGELGTRNISVSAGALWARLQRFTISAIDTSAAGTFDRYYDDGAGGHTKEAAQTQWNNTQYDDGSGTLVTMTNNRYACQWFYIELDGTLLCMYGTNQYTSLAAAESESEPTDVPARISVQATLIGRIIFLKSAGTTTAIESAFDTSFTGVVTSDHTSLSNLAWTSSGHTGTATRIAGFEGAGAAAEYTMSGTGTELALTTSPTFTTPVLGTPTSGALTNCTAYPGDSSLVTTGALDTGSITSGFGAIDNGASNITTTGTITGGTLEATGDTAAGDNSALGYTATEGAVLTGQGSTNDVTIKNDADETILAIPTGTNNVNFGVDGAEGALILAEKTSVQLDPAGGADGDYSGITFTATAGATIAFGDFVYLDAADSEWKLTDADAVSTAGDVAVAVAVTSGTDGNPVTLMTHGIIRADAKFPTLTIGSAAYLGTTAGAIQVAEPTGADDVVRVVGFALTANELMVTISPDHMTVTG